MCLVCSTWAAAPHPSPTHTMTASYRQPQPDAACSNPATHQPHLQPSFQCHTKREVWSACLQHSYQAMLIIGNPGAAFNYCVATPPGCLQMPTRCAHTRVLQPHCSFCADQAQITSSSTIAVRSRCIGSPPRPPLAPPSTPHQPHSMPTRSAMAHRQVPTTF